jgi:hypothetical protein
MSQPLQLTEIQYTFAPERDFERGLLGWVSCVVNGTIRLDGIAVRRTRRGRLRLSFPAKSSLTGSQFFYVRPLDAAAREHIEQQIFQALDLVEDARS